MSDLSDAERAVSNRVAADLTQAFHGIFSPETVEQVVDESFAAFTKGARLGGCP